MEAQLNDLHIEQSPKGRSQWEVADIFRLYGEPYRKAHPLPHSHLKVMQDIELCRTKYLGGHMEQCDSCGFERPAYNSCRNRHCPKCQALAKARWLQARRAELLPVTYFHNVFTLPHEINPIALCNKKLIFDLLFKAVSETLLTFGNNGLGALMGFISILHTWDQTLMSHFHLHCLIPGGALSFDHTRWISTKDNFLFPLEPLSHVFRGKFMHYLQEAFERGLLFFHGKTQALETPTGFSQLKDQLYANPWVLYSKTPFGGPEQVLDYLGRYTHRVAISNHRITNVQDGSVSFTYRDRRDKDKVKLMTLHAHEFIRRFLLHVLPSDFVRIRHFGFLANRSKATKLPIIRQLLGLSPHVPRPEKTTPQELILLLTGIDLTLCPSCRTGTMTVIRKIPKYPTMLLNNLPDQPQILDSS